MTWIALTIALATQGSPSAPSLPWAGGRVYSGSFHVGIRPAVDITPSDWGAGVTIQITAKVL